MDVATNFFTKYGGILIAWFVVFITPVVPAFLTIISFIFFDTVTGIWKAKKNKEPIQSRRLYNSITKFVMYSIAILSALAFEKYIFEEILPLTKFITGFIATIELRSLYENISSIVGVDLWTKLKEYINKK